MSVQDINTKRVDIYLYMPLARVNDLGIQTSLDPVVTYTVREMAWAYWSTEPVRLSVIRMVRGG
jgi:hypothetical protein